MSVGESTVEQILVVPTSLFHEVGLFQGFQPEAEPYLKRLLDPEVIRYRPRPEMEEDPSFKQLIPYCVFRCNGEVFHYVRGGGQGERRLHAKRSVGVGGHISAEDAGTGTEVYREAMWREIREEVYLESEVTERCLGLINDDSTEVGQVHLGIVHLFDLEVAKVHPRESSMIQTGFAKSSELISNRDQFETWSQICLDYLNESGL